MFDPVSLKREIDEAKHVALERVTATLASALSGIYGDYEVPDAFPDAGPLVRLIDPVRIPEDLQAAGSTPAFYIILSTYPVAGNECTLRRGAMQAIYRGVAYSPRQRLTSHLFNSRYNRDFDASKLRYEKERNGAKLFHQQHWPQCLKLHAGGASGANIDEGLCRDHSWAVVVHTLKGSSHEVRECAEVAFDRLFRRPAGSRE